MARRIENGDVNLDNRSMTGVPNPTLDDQVANKAYVDNNSGGMGGGRDNFSDYLPVPGRIFNDGNVTPSIHLDYPLMTNITPYFVVGDIIDVSITNRTDGSAGNDVTFRFTFASSYINGNILIVPTSAINFRVGALTDIPITTGNIDIASGEATANVFSHSAHTVERNLPPTSSGTVETDDTITGDGSMGSPLSAVTQIQDFDPSTQYGSLDKVVSDRRLWRVRQGRTPAGGGTITNIPVARAEFVRIPPNTTDSYLDLNLTGMFTFATGTVYTVSYIISGANYTVTFDGANVRAGTNGAPLTPDTSVGQAFILHSDLTGSTGTTNGALVNNIQSPQLTAGTGTITVLPQLNSGPNGDWEQISGVRLLDPERYHLRAGEAVAWQETAGTYTVGIVKNIFEVNTQPDAGANRLQIDTSTGNVTLSQADADLITALTDTRVDRIYARTQDSSSFFLSNIVSSTATSIVNGPVYFKTDEAEFIGSAAAAVVSAATVEPNVSMFATIAIADLNTFGNGANQVAEWARGSRPVPSTGLLVAGSNPQFTGVTLPRLSLTAGFLVFDFATPADATNFMTAATGSATGGRVSHSISLTLTETADTTNTHTVETPANLLVVRPDDDGAMNTEVVFELLHFTFDAFYGTNDPTVGLGRPPADPMGNMPYMFEIGHEGVADEIAVSGDLTSILSGQTVTIGYTEPSQHAGGIVVDLANTFIITRNDTDPDTPSNFAEITFDTDANSRNFLELLGALPGADSVVVNTPHIFNITQFGSSTSNSFTFEPGVVVRDTGAGAVSIDFQGPTPRALFAGDGGSVNNGFIGDPATNGNTTITIALGTRVHQIRGGNNVDLTAANDVATINASTPFSTGTSGTVALWAEASNTDRIPVAKETIPTGGILAEGTDLTMNNVTLPANTINTGEATLAFRFPTAADADTFAVGLGITDTANTTSARITLSIDLSLTPAGGTASMTTIFGGHFIYLRTADRRNIFLEILGTGNFTTFLSNLGLTAGTSDDGTTLYTISLGHERVIHHIDIPGAVVEGDTYRAPAQRPQTRELVVNGITGAFRVVSATDAASPFDDSLELIIAQMGGAGNQTDLENAFRALGGVVHSNSGLDRFTLHQDLQLTFGSTQVTVPSGTQIITSDQTVNRGEMTWHFPDGGRSTFRTELGTETFPLTVGTTFSGAVHTLNESSSVKWDYDETSQIATPTVKHICICRQLLYTSRRYGR